MSSTVHSPAPLNFRKAVAWYCMRGLRPRSPKHSSVACRRRGAGAEVAPPAALASFWLALVAAVSAAAAAPSFEWSLMARTAGSAQDTRSEQCVSGPRFASFLRLPVSSPPFAPLCPHVLVLSSALLSPCQSRPCSRHTGDTSTEHREARGRGRADDRRGEACTHRDHRARPHPTREKNFACCQETTGSRRENSARETTARGAFHFGSKLQATGKKDQTRGYWMR